MSVFLYVVGIVGVLISLLMLVDGGGAGLPLVVATASVLLIGFGRLIQDVATIRGLLQRAEARATAPKPATVEAHPIPPHSPS